MPIKDYVTGTVPYLVSYEPYNLGSKQACDNILDMLSFNLKPQPVPTDINYHVGAGTSYVTTLTLKNLTDGTTLDVQVEFDRDVFIINGVDDSASRRNKLTLVLPPLREYNYRIEIKKADLDSSANYKEFMSNILLTVTNQENGSLAVRSTSVRMLQEQYLPLQLNVI
jgi:hypothetical protein